MPLALVEFEQGVKEYWEEMKRRAPHVQAREHAFPQLALRYASRTPPHFTRDDLKQIMEWKHTDVRWFNRAMEGINQASDEKITSVTTGFGKLDVSAAIRPLIGAFYGVGVASVSAILAAARPDLYAVIDVFALKAIDRHYTFPWIDRMNRNKKGDLEPTYQDYPSYVDFCRKRAGELAKASGEEWTPRRVEMALWAIGKRFDGDHDVRCR